jgi:hypothetical protein
MRWLVPVMLLTAVSTSSSQNAPYTLTTEQCRADQKVWSSKLNRDPAAPNVSYDEMTGWNFEMFRCEKVNADLRQSYLNTESAIALAQGRRLFDFISRHHLMRQFSAEDKQGKQ